MIHSLTFRQGIIVMPAGLLCIIVTVPPTPHSQSRTCAAFFLFWLNCCVFSIPGRQPLPSHLRELSSRLSFFLAACPGHDISRSSLHFLIDFGNIITYDSQTDHNHTA